LFADIISEEDRIGYFGGFIFRSRVSAAGSGAGIGHRYRIRDQYLNLNP
jgi:hypothetical protein